MRIYLAGPITGLTFDAANDWRAAWTPAFVRAGHVVDSPLRHKEHLRPEGVLTSTFDEGRPALKRDLWDIDRADVVLVNLEGATETASIGTCCEIGYAYAFDKFIVVVSPRGVHNHLFINEMASIIVHDMHDAYSWINGMEATT